MNYILLFLITSNAFAFDINDDRCNPPSIPFFKEKISKSYNFAEGEKELKSIVRNEKNYGLREEVKALKRRLMLTDRKESALIASELQVKYDQMIANTETEDVIADYPLKGASSVVSSSPDGSIMISMDNLQQEDLGVIPEATLKKISKKARIQYKYPYDSFDYFLTVEGKELPIDKALSIVSTDFEKGCKVQRIENSWTREAEPRIQPQGAKSVQN